MLTINDLTWQGMFQFPAGGLADPGGPGTTAYSSGALAVRYVNGRRRFLVPNFTIGDPATGQLWGDLVEYEEPAGNRYTGPDPGAAPVLVETRRWKNWTLFPVTPNWQEPTTGTRIGGLYWDEMHGVLWYQLYGYYSGKNIPLLGAVRLLDTVTTGNYCAVGAMYGPWWYGSNNPADPNLYWKSVNYWMVPVPGSSQGDLGNRKLILGAAVASVGGAGNIGPGFRAVNDFPSLSDAPNSTIPLGLDIANYTPTGAGTGGKPVRYEAHRNTGYSVVTFPNHTAIDTGLFPPDNVGHWQMSIDQVNSFIWVETPTKEGILLFGRLSNGANSYGFNPLSLTPGWAGSGAPELIDPSRPIPESGNSYDSSLMGDMLYAFNPAQVREVGRQARSPYSDGINPIELGGWHTKWPHIPLSVYESIVKAGLSSQAISDNISNTGFWDTPSQQAIWVQPCSVGNCVPTVQFFTVGGTPPVCNPTVTCIPPPGCSFSSGDTCQCGILACTPQPPPGPPGSLPAPNLTLPRYLPVNGQITASVPPGYQISLYTWSITPQSAAPAGRSSASAIVSKAASANFLTTSGVANLGPQSLTPGNYLISVTATDSNGNVSPAATASVTLVPGDLSGVRVYPNPWRSDKHSVRQITFDQLTVNTTIKIFTVSGHWVKTLPTSSTTVTWDLTNDSGDRVASGMYMYLITTDASQKKTGQLAVIK